MVPDQYERYYRDTKDRKHLFVLTLGAGLRGDVFISLPG